MLSLQPNHRVLLALASVARATKELQIGRVIRPAICNRNDVVNFKVGRLLETPGTQAALSLANTVNVFGGERSAVASLLGSVLVRLSEVFLSPKIRIACSHAFSDFLGLVGIVLRPLDRSLTVAGRVLGAALPRPLCFHTWVAFAEVLVGPLAAFDTTPAGNPPKIMAEMAWNAGRVSDLTGLASDDASRMLWGSILVSQNVLDRTSRAQPGGRVSLRHMTVPAWFAGPVESLTSKLSRRPFRHWFAHLNRPIWLPSVFTGT